MAQPKPDLSKYGPKVKTEGKIKVIVSGPMAIKSSDPRVVVERRD